MSGKIRAIFLWGALFPSAMLLAQSAGLIPLAMEELMYRTENEGRIEEFSELYEESLKLRVNLNSCTRQQLENSQLFNPFQIHQLLKYRLRYGPFYSIFELRVIPGFNKSQLQVLEPFLEFHIKSGTPVSPGKKYLLLMDIKQSHPESMAYQKNPQGKKERIYAGTPLNLIFRIRSQFGNKLSAGLTYEKDAGETLLYGHKPQFLSGYVAYTGGGFLKQFVTGTYKLNHGLGLVNGTGFFHDLSVLKINHGTLSLLKPYASKTEDGYERGAACRMGWKSIDLLLWASHTSMDLSPVALLSNPNNANWWLHQRKTGLFRSDDEIEGRDQGSRFQTGLQVLIRHKELAVGIMTGAGISMLNKSPGQAYSHLPVIQKNSSIHGNWLQGSWNVFGELAIEDGRSFAFQLGNSVQFNDFLWGTLLMFHCDSEYDGINPSSYPSGNQLKNQQGLAFHLHTEMGPGILANTTVELLHYPSPRHGCLVPSFAYRLGLTFQNPGIDRLNWRIRLKKKIWQNTPDAGKAGIRPIRETKLTRADLRIKHNTSSSFEWQSRLVLSFLSGTHKRKPAFAFLQEARLQLKPILLAKIQIVLFHVEDWDNRIYLHEPGFYYSFSFPAYYGEGQKTTFLITLKAFKALTLSCKVTGISYRNRDTVGSGYDLTSGNKRWLSGLQIQLRF